MIHYECPCGESWFEPLPDRPLPCLGAVRCAQCGTTRWLVYSRLDPRSYAFDDVKIDSKTGKVTVPDG